MVSQYLNQEPLNIITTIEIKKLSIQGTSIYDKKTGRWNLQEKCGMAACRPGDNVSAQLGQVGSPVVVPGDRLGSHASFKKKTKNKARRHVNYCLSDSIASSASNLTDLESWLCFWLNCYPTWCFVFQVYSNFIRHQSASEGLFSNKITLLSTDTQCRGRVEMPS